MAVQKIELADIGEVTLVKSGRSRNIRLSVTPSGVRVSMPIWTSFRAGRSFAEQHSDWIKRELAKRPLVAIEAGQRIGKLHSMRFEQILDNKPATSRVTATEVIVRLANNEHIEDATVQQRAKAAAARALKREAERLLPPRLESLAKKHNYTYRSISVKSLKRRWGSCDNNRNITFNFYLMDLSWEYIDYVICHELAHTIEMNHGPQFWSLVLQMNPRAKDISKQLKKYQPIINN